MSFRTAVIASRWKCRVTNMWSIRSIGCTELKVLTARRALPSSWTS
jgi:hypothetical protein